MCLVGFGCSSCSPADGPCWVGLGVPVVTGWPLLALCWDGLGWVGCQCGHWLASAGPLLGWIGLGVNVVTGWPLLAFRWVGVGSGATMVPS